MVSPCQQQQRSHMQFDEFVFKMHVSFEYAQEESLYIIKNIIIMNNFKNEERHSLTQEGVCSHPRAKDASLQHENTLHMSNNRSWSYQHRQTHR